MRRTPAYVAVVTLTLGFFTLLLIGHLGDLNTSFTNFAIAYTLMFGYLALNVMASVAAKPHERDPDFDYDALSVDVFVPVYNEDPSFLAAGIQSLIDQTRRPDGVWVIDDGSDDHVLAAPAVRRVLDDARAVGIAVHTRRQDNRGKRHAQAYGFEKSRADVFLTVDSDTILDPTAVEELLWAFSKPTTMSVGGLSAGQNHKESLLTRTVELGFVMAFLSGRLAEGYFGAVRVNCGIIAAYRREVVQDNLFRYLTQKWLGEAVAIGDDRALTIFARERGRTEFQATAVAYSALPNKFSHLIRQRVRWARSWYWGTIYLLRRPMNTPDFWFTVLQVTSMLSYLVAIVFALTNVALGDLHPRFVLYTVLTSMLIGAASTLRYVVAGRPDESFGSRLVTWLLSPLSSLLYMFALVPLYWYAGLRPRAKGWGTRSVVEVGLHAKEQAA